MELPNSEEALCERARLALARGDLHQAADHCKTLLLHFPQSAQGYSLTSRLFQATGNYKKACDYSAIATGLDACVSDYHMQQGRMLYVLKEYEQAESAFERAVELSDDSAEACRWLGNTLVALERFDEARKCFKQAREAAMPVDTTIDEAECALQSGNLEAAEALLQQALARHPRHAQAHYMLAIIALYLHEFDRAEQCLQEALRCDDRHVQAHFYKALLLAERGDERPAMEHLLKALQIDPTCIGVLLLLGGLFMRQGDRLASEKAFAHVLVLVPDHLLAWYSLLELMEGQNRLKEAIGRLNRVMESLSGSTPLRHLRGLFHGDVPPCTPAAFVIAFYAAFIDMFEPWVVAASEGPYVDALVTALWQLPQLAEKRYTSLLDLGCGTGVVAQKLADRTAIRVGVDISPQRLRIARRAKQYDVLYEVDLLDYVLGSESCFDVIVLAGALRWSGNLQPFFQGVRTVMHKDSVLAFSLEKELSTLAYSVNNHGRYSHHFSYVQDVAQAEGLQLLSHKEYSASEVEDHAKTRHLFFFKKMTVH